MNMPFAHSRLRPKAHDICTSALRSRKSASFGLLLVLLAACSSESGSVPQSSGAGGAATGGALQVDNSGGALQGSGGGASSSGGNASGGAGEQPSSGGAMSAGGGATEPPSAGGTGGSTDPPPYLPEILLEEGALGFCSVDGVVEDTNAGFSGVGYANTDNASGAEIEWAVNVGEAGVYSLEFTFSNGGAEDRPGALHVNGAEAHPSASFPPTTDFTTWATVTFEVSLSVGENRIVLRSTTASGLANVDSLKVSGAALLAADCSSNPATGGAPGSGGMNAGTGGAEDLPDTTIYVAGDSTVSTYADTASSSDQAGWGQMLHEIFDGRVTVDNQARGGRTALWFHLEGGTDYVLDRILAGEYWFIQFGTNDSHPSATFTVDGVTYQRFADANTTFKEHLMDHYVTPARAKSAIPVLVTPPPRNSAYCGTGNSLGGYAQAMRDLAAAEGIVLLDLNQRTFDHLEAICPAPTPEDFFFLRADNTVDGTHFQENGARHMAGFLGDEMIAKSVGPYQYLLP